jgi:alkylation response protein AidB-like acyl-CoA dehydrogenase
MTLWAEEIAVEQAGEIFDRSHDEREIRTSVRGYLDRTAPLPQPNRDGAPVALDREAARAMAKAIGVYGVLVPERHGGAGLGFKEATTILEEMGRSLYGGAFLASAILAVEMLNALDPDGESEGELLAQIAAAETIATVVLCATDGRGSPATATPAGDGDGEGDGDGWTLDGLGGFVLDAMDADLFLVPARTPDDIGIFAVSATQANVTREALPTLDQTRPLGQVRFERAAGRLVGADGAGARALDALLPRARAAVAAEQVGAAEACLDEVVAYTTQRTQFGAPIGSFGAVQQACADVLIAIDGARSTQRYAAWAAATDAPVLPLAAAMAKVTACDAAFLAAGKSLQLHGGIGYTWEHPVHLFLKRAKSAQLLFGTTDENYTEIADLAGL